jgi:hypothetical protein
MAPAFEQAKIDHALDRTAIVISESEHHIRKSLKLMNINGDSTVYSISKRFIYEYFKLKKILGKMVSYVWLCHSSGSLTLDSRHKLDPG